MRLSIQHPLIQTHHIRLAIQQIKILQRLRQPETLHRVLLIHICLLAIHAAYGAVPEGGAGGGDDGFKHCPAFGGPDGGAGQAVEVEDGFYCFGAGTSSVSLDGELEGGNGGDLPKDILIALHLRKPQGQIIPL